MLSNNKKLIAVIGAHPDQASNTTAPTQYVTEGDNTYAYRQFGSGPGTPLLLLQHFTGTLDNWDPAIRRRRVNCQKGKRWTGGYK
jgi:hypothetical protein